MTIRVFGLCLILIGLWLVFRAAQVAVWMALWNHSLFFLGLGVFIVFVGAIELAGKRAFWRGKW